MNIKIDPNQVRESQSDKGFGFSIHGNLDMNNKFKESTMKQWINYWGFRVEISGERSNILIPRSFDLSDCFSNRLSYKYMNGFSPELNKNLNLDDFSNMITSKCFHFMGLSDENVIVLRDGLEGKISKSSSLREYKTVCKMFGYDIKNLHYASEIIMPEGIEKRFLTKGKGDYKGTEIFEIDSKKIIGKNIDGSTTNLYQDVALSYNLNERTLYLTGEGLKSHFELVGKLSPKTITHFEIGTVTTEGEELSGKNGEAILLGDILLKLREKFKDNKLSYNAIAGQILKTEPNEIKSINFDTISNAKDSPGIYLSYTSARLKSIGIEIEEIEKFHSNVLQYSFAKASWNYSPNTFLKSLVEHCEKINNFYENKDDIQEDVNAKVFLSGLLEDLELGMSRLGMFSIEKVEKNLDEQKLETIDG